MHLGIDASNIRQGGGVTHLVQLMSTATPLEQGCSRVTIWCNSRLTGLLPKRPWLTIRTNRWINSGMALRFLYQHFFLSKEMREVGCQMGFFPGGTLPIVSVLPAVTMSQNMLPFESEKARLFGAFSFMRLKMIVLRQLQVASFKRAVGIIFLSKYAQSKISQCLKLPSCQIEIPHGIESRFISRPRTQKELASYTAERPFQFLYTSILMPYKHQIEVMCAINSLRVKGYPIACQFIGPAWGWYGSRVKLALNRIDRDGTFLRYLGEVPFDQLHHFYQKADGFIFASSCENLPNILIEAMASGLPIACSESGPMPEILGDKGFYFDPALTNSIELALKNCLRSHDGRNISANDAYQRGLCYSWQECAETTFKFLRECFKFSSASK